MAAGHLTKKIPLASPSETVGEVRRRIERTTEDFATINYIYVIDEDEKLVGVVSLRRLLTAGSEKRLSTLMTETIVSAHESTPLQKISVLAVRHNIKAIPIVDHQHRLVGVVPNDIILSTLYYKMRATLLRSAGIHPNHTESILEMSLFTAFRHRILWIIVGLFGGLLAAGVVEGFSSTLQRDVGLAAFIPLVVYIGTAVGAQTQTLFIRDIAAEGVLPLRYALRQLAVSLLLALASGAVAYSVIGIILQSFSLGAIIAVSSIAGIMVASVIGLVIPSVLSFVKLDPADGSGPFATILTDITSVSIYFAVASLLIF